MSSDDGRRHLTAQGGGDCALGAELLLGGLQLLLHILLLVLQLLDLCSTEQSSGED